MNTKHFYKGKEVCIDNESINEVLSDCQNISNLIYELSKLKNIHTVVGTGKHDLTNKELFEHDIIYNEENDKFYYIKYKDCEYICLELPLDKNRTIKPLKNFKEKRILRLINTYELSRYKEIEKMIFGIDGEELTTEKMRKYIPVLDYFLNNG